MVQWKMARYLKVRLLLEMSYHFSLVAILAMIMGGRLAG